ncbi:hypothetical protein DITRI_Ditri13aG0028900 [Diplodiscus trichospermus]
MLKFLVGCWRIEIEVVHVWNEPPEGYLTCNVDAAMFKKKCNIGVGMILRGDSAGFRMCFTGFEWIISSEGSRRHWSQRSFVVEYGNLIAWCLDVLYVESNLSVQYVSRQEDVIAHTSSKSAYLSASMCTWDEPTVHMAGLLNV